MKLHKYKIYNIIFNKDISNLSFDYDRLTDNEKEKLAETKSEAFIDFELDKKYQIITITTAVEIMKYCDVLNDNLIDYLMIDLSDKILKSEIDIKNIIKVKDYRYLCFCDVLNKWIMDNLDIDIILDRINIVGIKKLKKIERDFLKNYK